MWCVTMIISCFDKLTNQLLPCSGWGVGPAGSGGVAICRRCFPWGRRWAHPAYITQDIHVFCNLQSVCKHQSVLQCTYPAYSCSFWENPPLNERFAWGKMWASICRLWLILSWMFVTHHTWIMWPCIQRSSSQKSSDVICMLSLLYFCLYYYTPAAVDTMSQCFWP